MSYSVKNRLRLINFEEKYRNSPNARAINNSYLVGKKLNEERINQLFYEIDTELGFTASCQCRTYRGNYYLGHKCPYCGTTVSSEFASDLEHINWLVLPDHAPAMIHPIFFLVLKAWLGKTKSKKSKTRSKISLIQSILDPEEELPASVRSHIRGQGFSYFFKHHEEIMDFFFHTYRPTKGKKDVSYIKSMYETYKDVLFIRQFPVLHPTLTPRAKEVRTTAIDPASGAIMSAISDLSVLGFESRRCVIGHKYVDKMLWKVYARIIEYVELIINKKYGDKYAHARRHIMGARMHYSGRGVCVPIIERHIGDECHLPLKIALGNLKAEIINLLTTRKLSVREDENGKKYKDKCTYEEAYAKYMKSLVVFDEEVYEVINILIKECPYKGLPIILGRNPTLVHGAIMLLYVNYVKPDLDDETIAVSPRICKPPNIDFDGDELYLVFIKEMGMVPHLEALHPMMNILSKSDLAVNDLITTTNQSLVHWNSFLNTQHKVPQSVRFEMV